MNKQRRPEVRPVPPGVIRGLDGEAYTLQGTYRDLVGVLKEEFGMKVVEYDLHRFESPIEAGDVGAFGVFREADSFAVPPAAIRGAFLWEGGDVQSFRWFMELKQFPHTLRRGEFSVSVGVRRRGSEYARIIMPLPLSRIVSLLLEAGHPVLSVLKRFPPHRLESEIYFPEQSVVLWVHLRVNRELIYVYTSRGGWGVLGPLDKGELLLLEELASGCSGFEGTPLHEWLERRSAEYALIG